jgi:hypothetical protein
MLAAAGGRCPTGCEHTEEASRCAKHSEEVPKREPFVQVRELLKDQQQLDKGL